MIDNAICSGAGGRAPKVPVTFQVRKDMAIQVPQRSPKTFYLNRFLPRNKVKFSKIKDKDRILKAAREVQKSHTYKGTQQSYQKISQQKPGRPGEMGLYIQLKEKMPTKNTLPIKVVLQNRRRDALPHQQKPGEFITIILP